jgi:uncharacterized lipoprotein NlpE involved in copper resistance
MKCNRKIIVAAISVAFLAAGLSACGTTKSQAIDAAHNSQNSLSWGGVYTGMIPAADGPGINVKIALYYDGTYEISYHYIDKADADFAGAGKFVWDEAGSVITLDDTSFASKYKVGENTLTQLDAEGKPIPGQWADMYVLKKTADEVSH